MWGGLKSKGLWGLAGSGLATLALPVAAGVMGGLGAGVPEGMNPAMFYGSPLEKDVRLEHGYGTGGATAGALAGLLAGKGVSSKLALGALGGGLGWQAGKGLKRSIHGVGIPPEALGYGSVYDPKLPHAATIPPEMWARHGHPVVR